MLVSGIEREDHAETTEEKEVDKIVLREKDSYQSETRNREKYKQRNSVSVKFYKLS